VPRAASQGQQTPPAAAASSNTPPGVDRSTYNASQAAAFSSPDTVRGFSQRLPEDIERKLRRIVQSVPGLGQHSRVIDVGSGTGCLIPHMQAQGVKVRQGTQGCRQVLHVYQNQPELNMARCSCSALIPQAMTSAKGGSVLSAEASLCPIPALPGCNQDSTLAALSW
jgi:hypothetical protein